MLQESKNHLKLAVLLSTVIVLSTICTFAQDTRILQRFGDKAFRQSQARTWNEEFTKLNAQIPTLSPAEERWLKTEIDETIAEAGGKYTARSFAAMDSKEYQIRVANLPNSPHLREHDAGQKAVKLWSQSGHSLPATHSKDSGEGGIRTPGPAFDRATA